jgi:cellulose synthase/poly-beta-1,6-N-acetylglucosamine synthase-like glycosyltransferase
MREFHTAILLVFCLSAGGVVYAYALYPALLRLLARLFGRLSIPPSSGAELPFISLLIAAHDEQAVIGERIQNALALDYPPERLEVIIASDGSEDRTAEIVLECRDPRVRLLNFPERRGKALVLNDAMREARGDLVLLSDANTFTDPDAARKLVRWFANPKVGAVCGKLILTDPKSGANADGIYWKYETFLKRHESLLGALLGANGAIYAIRKELFQPIAPNTIVDDFVIPLLAKQRSGCDIIYDTQAIAREESAPNVASEFRRRARIGAGGWQAIGMLWPLLNPARGWIAFTFFSHKVLRWICPFLLIATFVSTLLLSARRVFAVLLVAQVVLYGVALFGDRIPGKTPLGRIAKVVQLFVGMNVALLFGFFRWISGPQTGMWNRTQRQADAGRSKSGHPVATQG